MKLSEFIKLLESKLHYHGDGDVMVIDEYGTYFPAIIQTEYDFGGTVTYLIK